MGRISELSDELLIKILSFLPTKEAVSTCILSKQWEFLWMWLPKLEYISKGPVLRGSGSVLRDFIDKNLPLHRAPVIECLRLRLQLGRLQFKPEDVRLWVEIAVSRHVRELEVDFYSLNQNTFPSTLFTCKLLVTLKLSGVMCIDVPSMVCLPSLKTMVLGCVRFIDGKSLQQILSGCPVLEDLSVHFDGNNFKAFRIVIRSLQSLTLFIPSCWNLDGYEIDTPSLKYLKLEDWSHHEHYCLIKNMPKLREAYVLSKTKSLIIGSITSVKRLTICAEDVHGNGFVFNQLEHLNICVCKQESLNLLGQLLMDSPKLRVLEISLMEGHHHYERNGMVCWNQPSHVPECLLSSLQIFKWSRYFGRPQDRDIAVYILKNARHLKTATIVADTTKYLVPNLQMIKELALSPRASSTCQLVFVEDLN